MTDTLYADVSEWQTSVNDAYPYPVLCIRSNDGTYRDRNWNTNYDWCRRKVDDGTLEFFIVYFVWRPNWAQTLDTLMDMVGSPHPRMAVMIDVESWGGQIGGDQSDGINRAYWRLADWLGDRRRVIAYMNPNDAHLWRTRPEGLRWVVPSYGASPRFGAGLDDMRDGMVAHQYTDGQGYGGGLPEGAPPFGSCDMNAANGLDPVAFAAACGIGTPTTQEDDMTEDDRRMLREVHDALYTPRPSLVEGSTARFSLIDFVRLIDAAAWHLNNPEAK